MVGSGREHLCNPLLPPQTLPFSEVVAIAPRYEGAAYLPNQAAEMARLRRFPGFREVPGRFDSIRDLFAAPPAGIVHFSGHGVAGVGMSGLPEYAIRLEDTELDVLTMRGFGMGSQEANPFIFLNACDLGKAERVANFVDGWAPA